MGTLKTPTLYPLSLSNRQMDGALLDLTLVNCRSYEPGFKAIKSKRPCEAGDTPVIIVVHAVGVRGGMVDSRFPRTPFCKSMENAGNFPPSNKGKNTCGVAPSRPIIRSFKP